MVVRLARPLSVASIGSLSASGIGARNASARGSGGALYALSVSNADATALQRVLERVAAQDGADQHIIALAPDGPVYAAAFTPHWNLDRIDQRTLPLDGQYSPSHTGAGSTVYVVDTGVQVDHPEFGGRALHAYSAIAGGPDDANGHGTHVAGSIGSASFGIAKACSIESVRVLDENGSGTILSLASGLQYVLAAARPPAVINLSLGYTGANAVIDSYVRDLVDAGLIVTAATGNAGEDSCKHYPSALGGVISVGASTISLGQDTAASFSNYGTCVTVFAPGTSIRSTYPTDSDASLSGTSMSTAHVSGYAALAIQRALGPLNAADFEALLLAEATRNQLVFTNGAPNLLLYVPAAGSVPSPSVLPAPSSAPSSTVTPWRGHASGGARPVACAALVTVLLCAFIAS